MRHDSNRNLWVCWRSNHNSPNDMTINPTRLKIFLCGTLWVVPALLLTQEARAALTHEYSFNDATTSTNCIDSVGGATGALYGGATYPGNGTVALDGNSGFVYLPNDIVSNYTSVTFEIWTTPVTEPTWSYLFSFGTSSGGPGSGSGSTNGATGLTWSFLTLQDGVGEMEGNLLAPPVNQYLRGQSPAAGAYHDIVFTIDAAAQTAALYEDGALVSFQKNYTITPQQVGHTYNDYIGRSQFAADPFYNGSIDEFRIYNNACSPAQAEADYEAGAGVTDASPGNLTLIQFDDPSNAIPGQIITPILLGTYSALTNTVNITTLSGVTFSSDDTNVVMLGSDGDFHAVAVGSTVIRASYQTFSTALMVTVAAQTPVLLNRYSFDGAPGDTTITDSVSGADGTLINGSGTAELTGNGQLTLDGNASSAYVLLPTGLISTLTNATFETWVENQDPSSDWAELWTFGTNNGSAGINYLTMIPNDPPNHEIRLDEGVNTVHASESLPYTNEVCLTVVYNYLAQNGSIYVNGRKLGSGTMTKALYGIPDTDNYIGQSQFYGGGDPYLDATLDEFRIYSGAESDLQVAIDAAAGPDNIVTNPGALQSVTVTTASTNVDVHGVGVPIEVLANFARVSGVDVTTLPGTTVTSGNGYVGTMAGGSFVPKNAGSAVVTGTYDGMSGSVALSVFDTNAWPSLVHRWRFNEPPGSTTITDVVGTINGTVEGPMTFDGQKMSTPSIVNQADGNSGGNGMPAATAGWVEFPGGQGLISGLPNEASIETWVVWNGLEEWAEIWDFGQASTPGTSSGGYQYLMICGEDNSTPGVIRAEWDENPAYDVQNEGPVALPVGTLCQLVYVHDQDRQVDKIYLNGQLVEHAANTALWSSLPDTDNWLARDEWPDPIWSGQYWDMRIWNGDLTAGQVANLYAAGPETIPGPQLQISSAEDHITLTWPANATAFTLQSSPSVLGPWTPVTETPTVANSLNNLTVPTSQSQTYYRLSP